MEATIIYYTSNKEGDEFEERVKQNILNVTDIPIISVSQKPIDFGNNLCVGDVGASGFNMFRQVQLACKAAKTRFVISAEADCLYPPDYFTFMPEKDNVCYRNSNVYVMPQWRPFFFHKKEGATHAQIIGREFYLKRLDELFKDAPMWSVEEKNFPKERGLGSDVFDIIEHYKTKNPVVQIKTKRSMRHYTHSERVPIHDLPYWGNGEEFRKEYYGDN